jgi:hypothetical protein
MEAQQWAAVIEVYAEMGRARARLDEAGYRVLCHALHRSGQSHRVPAVLRDMSCAGFQYDGALLLVAPARAHLPQPGGGGGEAHCGAGRC